MAGENSFIKVLDKAELAKRNLEAQMVFVRRFYQDANFQAAYDAALRLWSTEVFPRRFPEVSLLH